MGTLQILLGKTRRLRRGAIAHAVLSGVDPFGKPNFLYVTDTRRKKDLVQSEFLAFREGAAFPPEVATVSALLELLCTRHGDGRALWRPAAVGLVADRLLAAAPEQHPWLARLRGSPEVAAGLARAHAQWDEAGRPPIPERPALARFLHVLHTRLAEDPARRPLGDALRSLAEGLRRPHPALASWLDRPHVVIFDDLLHVSAARAEVLVALARAWKALGRHVVFCFESGRDLGGREAGAFFAYEDADDLAFSLRPFEATRSFRHRLFATLVAEGGEAEVWVAGEDGTCRPAHDPAVFAHAGPADLADHLYGSEPVAPALGRVRLERWPDRAAEARGIVAAIKRSIVAGAKPAEHWLAVPGLPAYQPLLERAFGRAGVPVEFSVGEPLAGHPVAGVVGAVLGLAVAGFPTEGLLGLLGSGYVAGFEPTAVAALGRRCREAGVRGGPVAGWRARVVDAGADPALLDQVAAAEAALAGLAAPRSARAWVGRVGEVLEALGVFTLAAAEAGAAEALGAVLGAVEQVAEDARAAEPGDWEAAALVDLAQAALREARTGGRRFGGDAVQVVGLLELRGIHPAHLWLAGLVADALPGPPPGDWLLPRASRRALGFPDPVQEARYLFASALRNAQADGHALTLTWPATEEGKPLAPSPLLEDLLAVPVAGGGTVKDHVAEPSAGEGPPLGPLDLDAAQAAWGLEVDDARRRQRAAVDERRREDGFGEWDGTVGRALSTDRPVAVTAFESWLACPMRYFLTREVGLVPERPWEGDLPPADRGTLLHAIVSAFVREVRDAGVASLVDLGEAEVPAWRARLHRVGMSVLARAPVFAALPAPLRAHWERRWLAGLVEPAPLGLLGAWLDVERTAEVRSTIEDTERDVAGIRVGPIELRGRVDRVDRLPDGAPLVFDYKTGEPPKASRIRAGLAVQPLVYLDATGHRERPGAAAYVRLSPRDPGRRATWAGTPVWTAPLAGRHGARHAVSLAGADADALRAYLHRGATRLVEGTFHPTLAGAEAAGCASCDYRAVCRVDHPRNARIAAKEDPRWQAPHGTVDASNEEDA